MNKLKDLVKVSFVIPLKNEEKSLLTLYKEITFETKKLAISYEIIFVDDGSTDNSFDILKSIHQKDPKVKVVKLRGNFGKSVALQAGFEVSCGEIIITLDADLQDDPKEIKNFINKIEEGYDLVSGWKKVRHDPLTKKIPSFIGNLLLRVFTRTGVHDLNCGFKAYRKEVVKNLNLYGEMYKFIPIIVEKERFKVGEIIVEHRKRKYGKSKFGWQRNLKGILDLITITFLTVYLQRPGHFFGTAGFILNLIGISIGIYISYLRLTTGSIQYRYPLLIFGILTIIVGVQLISMGLIAEMIVNLNQRNLTKKRFVETTLN